MLEFYPGMDTNIIIIERNDEHVGHIMWPKENENNEDLKEPLVVLTKSFEHLTLDEIEQVQLAFKTRYDIMRRRDYT
jgi:hypothetical protein